MMSSDLVTALQEGIKITVDPHRQRRVRVDRRPLDLGGLGRLRHQVPLPRRGRTALRRPDPRGLRRQRAQPGRARHRLPDHRGPPQRPRRGARADARATVLTIETDPAAGVPGYESWWDVPPAEVSEMDKVKAVRRAYEEAVKKERWFL